MFQDFHYPHSAEVRAWLDCGEYGRVMLGRVTPKSVVAKAVPPEIPPCDADLVVTVDGQAVRNRVRLRSGFTKGRRVALVDSVAINADGTAAVMPVLAAGDAGGAKAASGGTNV